MLAVARRIAFALVAALLFAGGFEAMALAQGGTPGKGRGGVEGTTQADDRTTTAAATTVEKDEHKKAPEHRAAHTKPGPRTAPAAASTTTRPTTAGSRKIASTAASRRSPARAQRPTAARGTSSARASDARGPSRTDPATRRDPTAGRAKGPARANAHAVALPVASIMPGDHPRDRAVSFLPQQFSGWLGIVGGLVVLLVGVVLGAGVWAKRRVLKL